MPISMDGLEWAAWPVQIEAVVVPVSNLCWALVSPSSLSASYSLITFEKKTNIASIRCSRESFSRENGYSTKVHSLNG